MPLSERAEAPLDEAERLARELADYEEHDEEITANVHVHVDGRSSIPDSDPPLKEAKKQLTSAAIAIGSGVGIAALTAIAALLQNCHGH